MPIYSFFCEETETYEDVFFHMNDVKNYNGKDGSEIGKWRRVYTSPNASIDSKINPFSSKDFVEKTGKKRDTYGSLLDRAKEASIKRTDKEGFDPVRNKYLADYKKTNGVELFDSNKNKVIKSKGITVDFGAK